MATLSPFRTVQPLVLASGSPRRQEFLRELGIRHTVQLPPETAEPLPAPGEDAASFAARAALLKAHAVAQVCPESVVLAADTVVALDGAILGKPVDTNEAFAHVKRLAGREHTVITACCLCLSGGFVEQFAVAATVVMGAWPDSVLRAYANSGEGLDKAGGYAVQGIGAFLVAAVHGSWSTVVGLPVAQTVEVLLRRGIIAEI